MHRIFHLDIKPSNILLRDREPIVADFGICFIDDGEVTLTKEGHRGSLYYLCSGTAQPEAYQHNSLGRCPTSIRLENCSIGYEA